MIAKNPDAAIDEILHLVCKGVRDQAYTTAGISPENAKQLSGEGFNELATRIIDVAAANTIPNDAICATAKALGVLVASTAQHKGCSQDELLKFAQEAVAQFAQDARASIGVLT